MIVDTRERDLIPLLPGAQVKTLPVGDIWIGVSGEEIVPGGIVFERKTIADMEASMADGRYREQRTRLQAFAQEKGCSIAYLFEGEFDKAYRYSKPVLWKWIVRLPFVHKIPYFQTKSLQETAEFLQTFAAKWKEDEAEFRDGKQPPTQAQSKAIPKVSREMIPITLQLLCLRVVRAYQPLQQKHS